MTGEHAGALPYPDNVRVSFQKPIAVAFRSEEHQLRYRRLRRSGSVRQRAQPHDRRPTDEHARQGAPWTRPVDDGCGRQRRLDDGRPLRRKLSVPHRRIEEHPAAAVRRMPGRRRHVRRHAAPPAGQGHPPPCIDATRHPPAQ